MKLGFKLIAEGYGPTEIVRQAQEAERAGFDFVEVSDHYHPWLYSQQHSGHVWSMLGAMAQATERIELATGVTCPIIRQHPAIVAQAAATVGVLSGGRFTLGLGAGERLNEHVTGVGWPSVTVRHEMLREAIQIIRQLWEGGYQSYEGKYLTIDDARVFDLPEESPRMVIASGGAKASSLAAQLGDGLFVTEPKPELVDAYRDAGGDGPTYAEVPLSYAGSEDEAAESAHRLFRFGQLGWKVMSELPNPINFEAAASWVTVDAVREAMGCGPDIERHVEVTQQFIDAGCDHLALINAGPDMDAFFAFFADDLGPRLRELEA
ncbi:TIGR03557 family F420-dependent LLM class oxidoreductase [Luteipulveratus flavus]|uniref:TIGR03557 family F420-dependent LLM class oxidoreductase n=1 Tax=Luteipulveratus flavus TaxID=3031728 RepID=A0ABT6CB30_9MICO|nr:TIGR03557 family F420-dependent LLM class oxidoreductase [Luteipulveratus sp. YIM 133296]MDF8266104.1 TIGR03557 family F420-dependent LLM class oxidoreductase [Luteipulveratus sp. YIM 133296]